MHLMPADPMSAYTTESTCWAEYQDVSPSAYEESLEVSYSMS